MVVQCFDVESESDVCDFFTLEMPSHLLENEYRLELFN